MKNSPARLRKIVLATNNRQGEREHEIVAALQAQASEPVLNKVTMGAFASTGIDTLLRAKQISEIVCTGVSTNNCARFFRAAPCHLFSDQRIQ